MSKFMPPKPEFKPFIPMTKRDIEEHISKARFNEWYDTHIKPLFENAVELSGRRFDGEWVLTEKLCGEAKPQDTHTCVAINIQPVQPESAEDILRELVDKMNYLKSEHFPWQQAYEKARKWCNCDAGVCPHWDLPRWTNQMNLHARRIDFPVDEFKCNGISSIWQKAELFKAQIKISELFWKDYFAKQQPGFTEGA